MRRTFVDFLPQLKTYKVFVNMKYNITMKLTVGKLYHYVLFYSYFSDM